MNRLSAPLKYSVFVQVPDALTEGRDIMSLLSSPPASLSNSPLSQVNQRTSTNPSGASPAGLLGTLQAGARGRGSVLATGGGDDDDDDDDSGSDAGRQEKSVTLHTAVQLDSAHYIKKHSVHTVVAEMLDTIIEMYGAIFV